MRNERAWPQQCWKSCANGSNIVALRFGDHGTKEMLGVVGWKVWPVSNFAQQHPTTCNRVCKRTQHVPSNKVESCWPTMLCPFARGLTNQCYMVFWLFLRCPWLNCAHSGMVCKISWLCTSKRTKFTMTIKTDNVTSSRRDLDPHGRLRAARGRVG